MLIFLDLLLPRYRPLGNDILYGTSGICGWSAICWPPVVANDDRISRLGLMQFTRRGDHGADPERCRWRAGISAATSFIMPRTIWVRCHARVGVGCRMSAGMLLGLPLQTRGALGTSWHTFTVTILLGAESTSRSRMPLLNSQRPIGQLFRVADYPAIESGNDSACSVSGRWLLDREAR